MAWTGRNGKRRKRPPTFHRDSKSAASETFALGSEPKAIEHTTNRAVRHADKDLPGWVSKNKKAPGANTSPGPFGWD